MLLMFESISIAVKSKQLCNNTTSGVLLKRINYGFGSLKATLADFVGLIEKFDECREMQRKCVSDVWMKQERNRKFLNTPHYCIS